MEVNDRIVLSRGGPGYKRMTMHKCIITRASKHTIWCYDYGYTSDGKELCCSVPNTRAIKIEDFGFGPDLVEVCAALVALDLKDWSGKHYEERLKELYIVMSSAHALLEEINKEEE